MSGVVCNAYVCILNRSLTNAAGLFSSFDCAVKGVRRKEDPYNASKFVSSIKTVASG